MNAEAQRIAIAEACGWKRRKTRFGFEWEDPTGRRGRTKAEDGEYGYLISAPSYLTDLNAMHEAEKVLDLLEHSKRCSSSSEDHAPMRYLAELGKVCGLKTREELVISCEDKDRGKLNFRPGPYPTPIELPPSAIVLGHFIPAYGYETCLIMATAAQRAEAFLRAIGKWKDS